MIALTVHRDINLLRIAQAGASGFRTVSRARRSAILFGILLVLTHLRVDANVPPAAPSEAQLRGILQSLERDALAEMHTAGIPGMAYAVVKGDRVIYAKGFGVRKHGEPAAVDENTLFEIGSVTKSFTATLVAMLVDEGKLNWTDPVLQHLPDFKMKTPWVTREMQIADVLCHRSGMPGYQLDAMPVLGFQRPDMVRAVRWVAPVSSFRSEYAYSNTLYLAAGQIIETKRGRSWEEDLSERLLQPLGMHWSTGDPDAVIPGNVATGHIILSDGSLWPIPENWRYRYVLKTIGPAGSIYSNISDMAQWLRFQLANAEVNGKQLVSPENLNITRAPRTLIGSNLAGSSHSYAMGWIVSALSPYPLLWHNGGTDGMHSVAGFVPGADIGIAVLTNADSAVPEKILGMFYALYFQPQAGASRDGAASSATLLSEPLLTNLAKKIGLHSAPMSIDQIEHLVDPDPGLAAVRRPLSRYAGAYTNPAYGRFTVEVRNKRLVMTLGPAQIEAPLVRYRGDVFIAILPDHPQFEIPLKFLVDRNGLVTGLFVPALSDVNGGRFKRGG